MLIKETSERGVEFIYAIAPGLDIVFSNDKDIDALKKKLDQVSSNKSIAVIHVNQLILWGFQMRQYMYMTTCT